jgi:predicted alpha/beta hydrolase family esterase
MPKGQDASLIIVPGLGGSEPDHWQSHWERSYPAAVRVEQADWDQPDLSAWLERLASTVARNPGGVLVGHSLGCVLIAHLARRLPHLPIRGALLVAPADVDLTEQLPACVADFAPTPLGRLPFPAMTVASTNDPYMSIWRAREVANAWGTQFVNAGACGHINVAAGYGRWRAGERLLAQLLGSVVAQPGSGAMDTSLRAAS